MSNQKEMTLLQFQREFATEEACQEFMFRVRWPEGFRCPKCKGKGYYHIAGRHLFQCADPECRHQTSLTAGTVMHKTRTPLRHWFWAIYLVARDKRGHSALSLSNQLGIPYPRAWAILHKIRKAMGDRDAGYLLGNIIEVAGVFFGPPAREAGDGEKQVNNSNPEGGSLEWLEAELAGTVTKETEDDDKEAMPEEIKALLKQLEQWANSGPLAPKDPGAESVHGSQKGGIPVLTAMSLSTDGATGYLKMQVVPEFGGDQTGQFIGDKIEAGSSIPADAYRAYNNYIENDWEQSGRYSKHKGRRHLKRLYTVIGNARALIRGTYHGLGKKHLQRYLDEFCYRFNRRRLGGQLFQLLLGACVQARPLTYAELIK